MQKDLLSQWQILKTRAENIEKTGNILTGLNHDFLSLSESQKVENTQDKKETLLWMLLEDLSNLTFKIISAAAIQNKIGAQMAEIIGQIIANKLPTLTKDAIEKEFRNFIESDKKTVGLVLTSAWENNGIASVNFTPELSQLGLLDTYSQGGKHNPVSRTEIEKINGKPVYGYSIR